MRPETRDQRLKIKRKFSGLLSPVSCLLSQQAQALIELAIFGSFILMVLGALINYGLNADFSQHAAMDSFRKALSVASDPNKRSATYVVVNDRHIPSPSHPFGTGSIVPVSASASVSRNFRMQESPTTNATLPRITMEIRDHKNKKNVEVALTTAGFRPETGVTGIIKDKKTDKWINDKDKIGGIDTYEEIFGLVRKVGPTSIVVIDSCEGEVISRDACIRQARLIVDQAFCKQECEAGKRPADKKKDCGAVCAQSIHVPLYAQDATHKDGRLVFPNIEAMFLGIRAMGLQPGSVKQNVVGYTVTKQEDASGIGTTSAGTWTETTTRTIRTRTGPPQDVKTTKTIPAPHDATWGKVSW